MEDIIITGDAHDAEVVTAPTVDSDDAGREQQRVHAYLVHCEDAERALQRAEDKVREAEARLEDAKASVEKAEGRLAALLGRD